MADEQQKLRKALPNYAFIDAQNLYLGAKEAGVKLSYKKFRVYLREKYNVERAYLFIGYIPENQNLYDALQEKGFLLKFKPVLPGGPGQKPKEGNVDADLAFNVMRYYKEYAKAIVVTGDGDFDNMVKYLRKKGKLAAVIAPNKDKCSALLQKAGATEMQYLGDIGEKIVDGDTAVE
jgi:uncharacterized LabA/DUF88 family protein